MLARRTLAALAAPVLLLTGGAVVAPVASAAVVSPTAFTCNNDLFFAYRTGDFESGLTTNVSRLTRSGSTVTVTDFGVVSEPLNALGYNPADNFLYAIGTQDATEPGTLYRIGDNGVAASLGIPTGLDTSVTYNAATFIDDDHFLVSAFGDGDTTDFTVIDIPTKTVLSTKNVPGSFADYAANPLDGKVYGFDQFTGQLATIDPVAGTSSPFGVQTAQPYDMTIGSTWFVSTGAMLLYGSPPTGGSQDRFYDGDAGTNAGGTGTLTELGLGPVALGTDGASCVSLEPPSTTTTTTAAPTTTTTTAAPTSTTTTTAVPAARAVAARPAFAG